MSHTVSKAMRRLDILELTRRYSVSSLRYGPDDYRTRRVARVIKRRFDQAVARSLIYGNGVYSGEEYRGKRRKDFVTSITG